jgi:glycosyltransferase involved in cell wall biosynthesis
MRILCVTQRYHPAIGGAENLIKTYLDFLSIHHEVTVFTSKTISLNSFWIESDSMTFSDDLEYTVKRFNVIIPSNIKNDKNLERFPILTNYPGPLMPDLWVELLSKELKYDLIIATAFPYDHVIPAYVAAKKWSIPIITIPLIHDEFPELFLTGLKLSILYDSTSILVLSQNEKKLLVDLNISSSKIYQISPYLQKTFVNKDDLFSFKKKYELGNKQILFFLGSKSYVKGIITLIESMKLIWKNNNDVILLLGGPTTKEFEKYFHNLPEPFKKNIIDLGLIDKKTKDLAFEACNLFVLPSKSESFGLVIIEAWIHEKPVIGCNISASRELIDDMTNGLLVPFGNTNRLSYAISKLLKDRYLTERLGKEGLKKSSQYTDSKNLANFEKICIETIDKYKKINP